MICFSLVQGPGSGRTLQAHYSARGTLLGRQGHSFQLEPVADKKELTARLKEDISWREVWWQQKKSLNLRLDAAVFTPL